MVSGAVIGITQSAQTLTKFFLVSKISRSNSSMVMSCECKTQHHELSTAVSNRSHAQVSVLLRCFHSNCNLFTYEGNDLINLCTRAVAPEKVKDDMCAMPDKDFTIYNKFVKERIVDGSLNLWDTLPNVKLQLLKSAAKRIRMTSKICIVELKDDHTLFSRLIMLCRYHLEIDLKQCFRIYELSVVLRSMFAADGTMIHLQGKSKLIHLLEKFADDVESQDISVVGDREFSQQMETDSDAGHGKVLEQQSSTVGHTVAVIDGIAELQSFNKHQTDSCNDLCIQFSNKLFTKYKGYSQLHIVFDTCTEHSLNLLQEL